MNWTKNWGTSNHHSVFQSIHNFSKVTPRLDLSSDLPMHCLLFLINILKVKHRGKIQKMSTLRDLCISLEFYRNIKQERNSVQVRWILKVFMKYKPFFCFNNTIQFICIQVNKLVQFSNLIVHIVRREATPAKKTYWTVMCSYVTGPKGKV